MSMLGLLSESVESVLARIEGWLDRAGEYVESVGPWRRRIVSAVFVVAAIGVGAAKGQSAADIVADLLFLALLGAVVKSIWWLGAVPPRRRWREYRDTRYLKRRHETPDPLQ